jgi:hypothetical protein
LLALGHERLIPSIDANSSVAVSTPAASCPSTVARFSAKWKIANVVSENSTIAGTVSSVRISSSRSLRSTVSAVLKRRAP